jgi:uncharacterized protein DUF4159
MRLRTTFFAFAAVSLFLTAICAQVTFREYPFEEVNFTSVPAGAYDNTDWNFARLRYPSGHNISRGYGTWPIDYPKADRQYSDIIFHVLCDLDEKIQVMGTVTFGSGRTYEKDGVVPHWRGIYDDRGRVMLARCFNQDNGDAWEWADSPEYPEKAASQAYRLGINYIIYAMTH